MAESGTRAHRVPVEHRWAGLDRRSLPYAAVALGVLALWAWVMPWVADQVAWDDPIEPGEAIQVTDEVTMAAAPGWGVVSGSADHRRHAQRARPAPIRRCWSRTVWCSPSCKAPFDESPARLLDQAELIIGALAGDDGFAREGRGDEPHDRFGPAGGRPGLHLGARRRRPSPTFVVDDTGIEIQSAGPRAQMAAHADEVEAMIDSLATSDGTDGSGS